MPHNPRPLCPKCKHYVRPGAGYQMSGAGIGCTIVIKAVCGGCGWMCDFESIDVGSILKSYGVK